MEMVQREPFQKKILKVEPAQQADWPWGLKRGIQLVSRVLFNNKWNGALVQAGTCGNLKMALLGGRRQATDIG